MTLADEYWEISVLQTKYNTKDMSLTTLPISPELEEAIRKNRSTRVQDAFKASYEYAEKLQNPAHSAALKAKLTRSYVAGSKLFGVDTPEAVLDMLASVKEWETVPCASDDVICLQGELPPRYHGKAYTGYATANEISKLFPAKEMEDLVKIARGSQNPGELYHYTHELVPTKLVTVQLKCADDDDSEFLKQWFAGPERSSIFQDNDGDVLVRCNVKKDDEQRKDHRS